MKVKQLIKMLLEENQEAVVAIQVSYKTGYIESNKVELDVNAKGEVVLNGMYTDGDTI